MVEDHPTNFGHEQIVGQGNLILPPSLPYTTPLNQQSPDSSSPGSSGSDSSGSDSSGSGSGSGSSGSGSSDDILNLIMFIIMMVVVVA